MKSARCQHVENGVHIVDTSGVKLWGTIDFVYTKTFSL